MRWCWMRILTEQECFKTRLNEVMETEPNGPNV